MIFREAVITDIPQMQDIRNAVQENRLSNPSLVVAAHYEDHLFNKGKGWVCTITDTVVGFAIADLLSNNVWALFVHPGFEKRGIGKTLHNKMLDWYFSKTDITIWLSTSPATRAENFYRKAGWREAGLYGKGEIKFEMSANMWKHRLALR